MKNNKRVMVYSLLVLGIFLLAFGGTYAWFTATASGDEVTVKSGKLSVQYTKGSTISGNLYPAASYKKGLSTTVYIKLSEGSLQALGTLRLELVNVPDLLKTKALNWELRDPETEVIIREGDFYGAGDEIILYENFEITESQKGYSLYIWLDGNMAGNEVQNLNFTANLIANAVQKNYVS